MNDVTNQWEVWARRLALVGRWLQYVAPIAGVFAAWWRSNQLRRRARVRVRSGIGRPESRPKSKHRSKRSGS